MSVFRRVIVIKTMPYTEKPSWILGVIYWVKMGNSVEMTSACDIIWFILYHFISYSWERNWSVQHGYSFLTFAMTLAGQKHTDYPKNLSLWLNDLITAGRHYVGVSFITSLKSNSCTALTTQNTTGGKKYCIISRAQNTTALQNNVFTTEMHRLPVAITGGSAFYSANHWPKSTANTPVRTCSNSA